jgi:hypothetical protein
MGLLSTTGGELQLDKCFYYLLNWIWGKNGTPIPQSIKDQMLPELEIKLSTNKINTKLEQKEVFESHKTLGTYKCVVGVENEQFDQLMKKSDNICKLAKQGKFNTQQSWLAYRCCYIPSMVYSLTAVSLSEKQLNLIQQKAATQFTRGCGFDKSFPKSVVHGPICFGGLGFNNLYVESNSSKIESLICHLNKKSTLGEIMQINLNWVQLHTGINTSFLMDTSHIDYIQDNWFIEIREFLLKCNANILIKNIWQPKSIRTHDKCIMNEINDFTTSKYERVTINNWRLYFQVTTIAELINYTGDCIKPEFLCKIKSKNYISKSMNRWPIQQIPCSSTFILWCNYILQVTDGDKSGKLRKKLGTWSARPNNLLKILSWIHTSKKFILVCENELWIKHPLKHMKHSSAIFHKSEFPVVGTVSFINMIPVDITLLESTYIIKCRDIGSVAYDQLLPPIPQENPTLVEVDVPVHINTENVSSQNNIIEYHTTGRQSTYTLPASVTHRPNYQVELVSKWNEITNKLPNFSYIFKYTDIFFDKINWNKGVMDITFCSDGGVSNDKAGYGVVGSIDNQIFIQNTCKLPKIFNKYTSHRSEACGVLSALVHIQALVLLLKSSSNDNRPEKFLILCDNESVVKTLNKFKTKTAEIKDYYSPDFDILDGIVQLWRQLLHDKVNITMKHIKGHQDKTTSSLSDHAKLNIAADKLATKSLSIRGRVEKINPIPIATLFMNHLQIASSHKKILRQSYLSIELRDHLNTSNKWKSNTIDLIWWDVHEKALNSISPKKRIFIQKYLHNRLPTNDRQNLYYSYLNPTCKQCLQHDETQQHIFSCNCPKRESIRKKYFMDMNVLLDKNRTHHAIKTLITKNVSEWFNEQKYVTARDIANDASPTLIKAAREQQLIGWDNWMKGRWSSEWATLFNYNITTIDSGIKFNSSEKWAKDLILLTWEFLHEIWLERNKCEHDIDGDPTIRAKEKLIEIIKGESELLNYATYQRDEVELEVLINMPIENLQMLINNLKNAKEQQRKEKSVMLPK